MAAVVVAIIIITTTTIAVIAALVERTKLGRKPISKSSRSIWRLIFPKVLSTKPPEVGCAIFSHEFQKKAKYFRFLTPSSKALRFQRSRWRRRRRRRAASCTWTTQTIRRKSMVLKKTRTIKSPILISTTITRLPRRRRRRHQMAAYRNWF